MLRRAMNLSIATAGSVAAAQVFQLSSRD